MFLLFLGNCQVQAALKALRPFNPDVRMEYAGNSNRVALYNPARSEQLMRECDAIISQPIMNMDNPDNHAALVAEFGERVTFMPYIFLSGMFSMCTEASRAKAGKHPIIGMEIARAEIEKFGLDRAIFRFKQGKTPFRHVERYRSDLAELRRREEHCDFVIADYIENHKGRALLTHNHPMPDVIVEVAAQIADRFNLKLDRDECRRPAMMANLALHYDPTVLSPYAIEDIGLTCEPDLNWFINGRTMYQQIAREIGHAPNEVPKAPSGVLSAQTPANGRIGSA